MPSIQEHELRVRQRPRIVVVDSEPASARQTVATLMGAGYECKSFVECESAMATLQESGADVMVVDFSSEKSATELIRRVRMHSPETAVVLMVANPDGVGGGGCDASGRVRLPHQADQHR